MKIQAGEMPIGFVGVAGQEQSVVLGDAAITFVFRPAGIEGRLVGPLGDAFLLRIGGEMIFRKHRQLDRGAKPLACAFHPLGEPI